MSEATTTSGESGTTSGDGAALAAVDPRTERTLSAVLDASFELLMAEGPDAVTHGHVAAAANVSRTTVYKHFPTRSELLRATIEVFGHPLPSTPSGDLRADLRTMLGDLVADLADEQRSRAMAAMMERAMHDETVAAVRDGLVCEGVEVFRQIVSRAVATGELRPDIDVDLAMSSLVGTFFFRRFMVGEPVHVDEVDHVVDVFIDNHRPR